MIDCVVIQDENNPFSESFQQRERMEKLQQQEEQRLQMQRHLEQQQQQQHSGDQQEHEMTAGQFFDDFDSQVETDSLRVDLTTPQSLPIKAVSVSTRPHVHKKFFRFEQNLVCR